MEVETPLEVDAPLEVETPLEDNVIENPALDQIKENMKVIWKSPDGEIQAVTDKIDRRLKSKVKIIDDKGNKIKVPLKDIKLLL